MRFTLGKMFLAVAVLAIAFAGMKYRTGLWASGIFTLTMIVFAFGLLQAIRLSARDRIVAVVFAVIGIAYLMLATTAVFHGPRELLVTNYPLAWAVAAVEHSPAATPFPPPSDDPFGEPRTPFDLPDDQGPNWSLSYAQASGVGNPQLYHFFVIGHCVFSWVFAVLAAWIAGRMYDRRTSAAAN